MRVWIVSVALFALLFLLFSAPAFAQDSTQKNPSSSSSSRSRKAPTAPPKPALEDGKVSAGSYRNTSLGLTCKIPAGWVLRTLEMNAREAASEQNQNQNQNLSPQGSQGSTGESNSGRVLLAAFSRPPEARGQDVNSSVVIAAEPVAAYPGLKEAVQYVAPLTEVAKAQGFIAEEDPYEVAIGPKTLVQIDFHKDVGTRVMRQSTLIFLARGYAVSITVIGGTEDEVGDLVDGISFAGK
jgi:hypothetical protein